MMKAVYGFKTKKDAEKYADKNYYRGTYKIEETYTGNWRINIEKQNI